MPIERQRQQLLRLSLNPTFQFFLTVAVSQCFLQAPLSLKSVEMSVSCPLSLACLKLAVVQDGPPDTQSVQLRCHRETKQAQAVVRKSTLETLVALFAEPSVMGVFVKLKGGIFRLVKQKLPAWCVICFCKSHGQ